MIFCAVTLLLGCGVLHAASDRGALVCTEQDAETLSVSGSSETQRPLLIEPSSASVLDAAASDAVSAERRSSTSNDSDLYRQAAPDNSASDDDDDDQDQDQPYVHAEYRSEQDAVSACHNPLVELRSDLHDSPSPNSSRLQCHDDSGSSCYAMAQQISEML